MFFTEAIFERISFSPATYFCLRHRRHQARALSSLVGPAFGRDRESADRSPFVLAVSDRSCDQ
jgi:hypothetical protein